MTARAVIGGAILVALVGCATGNAPTTPVANGSSAVSLHAGGGGGRRSAKPRPENSKRASSNRGGNYSDGTSGSRHPAHSSTGRGGTTGTGTTAAPAYPAAGTYVYSQTGTEEFCAGGNCDSQRLPPTERQHSKISGQSGGYTTMVSEIHSADGRYVRTTIDYSDSVAAITEVYYSFSYDGFSFSDDYKPSPPVRSVLFPLSVGKSWSGSWDAKTSGTYAMKVASTEDMVIDGKSTRTFRLDTSEHFTGEYRGTAAITVWIDPATKAVVKTSGALRLSNSVGSYDTNFTTVLQQGPGYP